MEERERGGGRSRFEVFNVIAGKTLNHSTGGMESGLSVPTSREMAKAALWKVVCRRKEVCGSCPHEVQTAVMKMLPNRVLEEILLAGTRTEMEAEMKAS